ncbi:PAAR domain-containing protein [Sulfitobacter sp. F26204]|uniref:PAAR domain-containing protein n=1 Tax=Sulfitobacter sp. F26204 TaxID=2996014 RepID=UPI00225E1EFC|nr:PAAR domain-containing protein [Sulfitobacter sp. F26204]MCX7561587.1 PAAR domain-containing protein [Sulfitobacter sp. F26204]
MKPTARLGDTHLCPAHGPNPIVEVASKSTCDGIPVATVGDKSACGAVILTGSAQCKTDGKPTARIGSRTSHGGEIITGSPSQMIP